MRTELPTVTHRSVPPLEVQLITTSSCPRGPQGFVIQGVVTPSGRLTATFKVRRSHESQAAWFSGRKRKSARPSSAPTRPLSRWKRGADAIYLASNAGHQQVVIHLDGSDLCRGQLIELLGRTWGDVHSSFPVEGNTGLEDLAPPPVWQ
jgi:hypothetical protein